MAITAFSYKQGNSFLHRLPAVVKILLIPVLNILSFSLHFHFTLSLLSCQFLISCLLHFSIKEQLKDLKPVIYYAVLLYLSSFLFHTFSALQMGQSTLPLLKSALTLTFTNFESLKLLLKLLCVMQSCSLIFRISTTLQIRQGIGQIETVIRKILPVSKRNTFTDAISLFFCFIPLVYKNWEQCKKAWLARVGKKNIKMFKSILPVFFSVGIRQAWYTSRAMLIREK